MGRTMVQKPTKDFERQTTCSYLHCYPEFRSWVEVTTG